MFDEITRENIYCYFNIFHDFKILKKVITGERYVQRQLSW